MDPVFFPPYQIRTGLTRERPEHPPRAPGIAFLRVRVLVFCRFELSEEIAFSGGGGVRGRVLRPVRFPSSGSPTACLGGTEERLRELLGDGIASFGISRRSFVFRYRSVGYYIRVLRNDLGPTRQAFEKLDREELEGKPADLVRRFNRLGDETMVVPSYYLEVVALRR